MRAPGEKPLASKLPHWDVDYQAESPIASQRCGNCSMFINQSPYRCTDVVSPIYKIGWCEIWAPKGGRGDEDEE